MAKEIRFRRISPTQYVVEVEDARTGVVSSLPDVGFGVSQILPALIQLQLMAPQSTLLMEQPEIHLHPTLQTALTDVLISATDTKRQVIAETHSELLLSRLQRRIAERKIALESVAILYVEMTPEGSVARELRLDEFGNFIDQLPTGFFSEEYTERLEQAKSVALRQRPAS
ncbi:MAG TPA: AAA family ATPase [Candidatus Limnocylindria bacterium]|jgi:predicted ATPase|nr:AAA family ATPase [Candidatus Limnocylindria bacterium]